MTKLYIDGVAVKKKDGLFPFTKNTRVVFEGSTHPYVKNNVLYAIPESSIITGVLRFRAHHLASDALMRVYNDEYNQTKDNVHFYEILSEDEDIEATVCEVNKERPDSEHYQTPNSIDVWAFAEDNFSKDEVTGFHRINAIKYITRFGKKGGFNITDLEKAKVYIDKLIEMYKEEG